MQSTLASVENAGNEIAPVSQKMTSTLKEFNKAARSFRVLIDYLERHPEALIRGKSGAAGDK
jgi:paraquat-inducible protein B